MAEHNRWIKFFPRDYLADTRLLTTEEHGAYFLLWCEIVMRDGKLPSDPATLQALALVRDTAKWKRIWGKIGQYFQLADGDQSLVQRRVTKELDHARQRVESARRAGRASAEVRENIRPGANGRSTTDEPQLNDIATAVQRGESDPSERRTNDQSLVRNGNQAEAEAEADHSGLSLPSRRSAPDQTRSNPEATSPLSASDWHRNFERAWSAAYNTMALPGGGEAAAKAVADLSDQLGKLKSSARSAAERRAPEMFREYLADASPAMVKARHPWAWFVTRFGGLLVPAKPLHAAAPRPSSPPLPTYVFTPRPKFIPPTETPPQEKVDGVVTG